MALLINRADIAVYRQISDTVYDDVLNMHITDAQFVDVQGLMGSDFYNDLILNPTTTANIALLDSGSYTHQGITYTNHGLKSVIVHYAYSRYAMFGSVVDTPFSLVEKLNPDSRPVEQGTKKSIHKSNQQTAYMYWENVRQFLDRNSDDYPLWKNNCQKHNSGFRISKIDGSRRVNVPTRFRFNRY